MNDLPADHVRVCAPLGSHMPHMDDSQRTSARTSERTTSLKALFLRTLDRTSERTLPAQVGSNTCAGSAHGDRDLRASDSVPEHLAELASRVCLWRVEKPGNPARYAVAGPDHDLREVYPGAVPLFTRSHRDYVRLLPAPDEGHGP